MLKRACLNIWILILVLSIFGTQAASQENVIVSSQVGDCTLSMGTIAKDHTLMLRAYHPQGKACYIDQESMFVVLDAAFSKDELRKLEGGYTSLYIGRLIDYPWLSQYLADAAKSDKEWDAKKGKPLVMGINQYVSKLLSKKELLTQIEVFSLKGGYKVSGASVEKVLVGGFREVPLYQGSMKSDKVPYDAMVWFKLEKN